MEFGHNPTKLSLESGQTTADTKFDAGRTDIWQQEQQE